MGAGCLGLGRGSTRPFSAALPKFCTLMLDPRSDVAGHNAHAMQGLPQGFKKVKGAQSPRDQGPALTLAITKPA